MSSFTRMCLENVGDGDLAEKFQDALQRILIDLVDPKKDPLKARSVRMEVIFSPSATTTTCAVLTRCDVKLAPSLAQKTFADIDQHGQFVQYRANTQPQLPLGDNVRPLEPKEARE